MVKIDFVPNTYEAKWIAKWEESGIYHADDISDKQKSYLLIEFPYPSGERLHVGHARSYSCMDAVARLRRMKGMNVMFPLGWDAFGLPAENYAIKTGIHPSITTKKNIENAKAQAQSWGMSIDWTREINTTDPEYYKWTQWIFVQLYKKGLAYKKEIAVNWCPSCKINLANEEVIEGKCERCGTQTERRTQSQWLLKITEYADRLLADLETVNYREDIKQQQINWIGRKTGINITYKVVGSDKEITVFTTTPVNFGATFLVIAPEHEYSRFIAKDKPEVASYIEQTLKKSELERLAEGKQKTGVFTGNFVLNHVTGEEIPVWISDFVLANVGTGAVQGCPGHDVRDFEFANKFGIIIRRVVTGLKGEDGPIEKIEDVVEHGGVMVNSDFLNGIPFEKAMERTMDYFEEKGWGKRVTAFHLRDWVFSRQHYWGEPIPMVWCEKDGWQSVPEEQLPVTLPQVEKYQPTDTGESPLATMTDWLKTTCPKCAGEARRETDTMPNWAGSSWYFLRYIDPHCNSSIGSSEKLKYWLPVDWYNGGMEHTTLHLLYSRFWHKFLYDIGSVPTAEPYARRTSHGVILGPDGKRMSKSKGNVINPDEVVNKYGADTLRLYEMFIGPFDQMAVWSWESLEGVHRFLKRAWTLVGNTTREITDLKLQALFYKVSEKVAHDIEAMKFNTAVSAMMELVNAWSEQAGEVGKDMAKVFLQTLAPMAPFITEELHAQLGGQETSIHVSTWPAAPDGLVMESNVYVAVQVNGKVRGTVVMDANQAQDQHVVEKSAKENENVSKFLAGEIKRVVFVPGRVINFIVG